MLSPIAERRERLEAATEAAWDRVDRLAGFLAGFHVVAVVHPLFTSIASVDYPAAYDGELDRAVADWEIAVAVMEEFEDRVRRAGAGRPDALPAGRRAPAGPHPARAGRGGHRPWPPLA